MNEEPNVFGLSLVIYIVRTTLATVSLTTVKLVQLTNVPVREGERRGDLLMHMHTYLAIVSATIVSNE